MGVVDDARPVEPGPARFDRMISTGYVERVPCGLPHSWFEVMLRISRAEGGWRAWVPSPSRSPSRRVGSHGWSPGHLAGIPVFVAQGEQDTVLPRELLDRTWDCVGGDSGSRAERHRQAGGHAITGDVAVALKDWIASLSAYA